MPKGRSTQVAVTTQDAVTAEFRSGVPASDLARKYELTRSIVYGILKRNGLSPKTNQAHHVARKVDWDVVRREYETGKSLPKIASSYGISYSTARKALVRMGGTTRAPGLRVSEPLEKIISAYRNGESQSAIARRLGTSQSWVYMKLKQAGIPTQPRRSGRNHGSWKGGRQMHHQGYVLITLAADDPYASMRNCAGTVFEHRLVMARHLGRPLEKHETVHHKDGNKLNNKLRNLQLVYGRHGKGVCLRCRDCGSSNIEATEITKAGAQKRKALPRKKP